MSELFVDPTLKRLPFGIYQADLSTLHRVFVEEAPHPVKRGQIFSAFSAWANQIQMSLPEHTMWVNGGFVTHKDEPPKDIDVVILADRAQISAFPQNRKYDLLTRKVGDQRVQPMGGLVDGFLAEYSEDEIKYWGWAWTSRFDPVTRALLETGYKGFVEVIL